MKEVGEGGRSHGAPAVGTAVGRGVVGTVTRHDGLNTNAIVEVWRGMEWADVQLNSLLFCLLQGARCSERSRVGESVGRY